MFADFIKAFKPTKKEIEKQNRWLNDNKLPNKEDINLVKTRDNLYISRPLQDFNGQCTDCKHYEDNFPACCEGGKCTLKSCWCGWGFTCDEFVNKGN